jgi:5-methylcytosine-specific restriction endonuclease McrA
MPFSDKEKKNEAQRNRVAQRRLQGVQLLGGECKTCGSKDNLEFDHIDPKTKVSHRIWSWSWDRIEVELAKCQLLCHTCHKDKTKASYEPIKHGTTTMYGKMKCRCDPCKTKWNETKAAYRARGGTR